MKKEFINFELVSERGKVFFFVVNLEHRKINEKFRSSIPHGNFYFFHARDKMNVIRVHRFSFQQSSLSLINTTMVKKR